MKVELMMSKIIVSAGAICGRCCFQLCHWRNPTPVAACHIWWLHVCMLASALRLCLWECYGMTICLSLSQAPIPAPICI